MGCWRHLLLSYAACAGAWEFPQKPISYLFGQEPVLEEDCSVDIMTGSQFSGLTTYANLPYLNCFLDGEAKGRPYDIAIMGAPFDTGVTARPGARYGPRGIRIGSMRKYAGFGWSVYDGKNALQSWATVVDCGDVPLTVLDNKVALAQLEKAHTVVSGRRATTEARSAHPRILTLGGDHTTTLAALRSTFKRWGQVSVVHFDSHIDTWDPMVLGGVSEYAGINHGTFLHVAHEEGLIRNTSIHAGVRAPLARRRDDLRNDARCGFVAVTARDLDAGGAAGVAARIRDRVRGSGVYVSVDVDVLDPAFAPATGTPEPGGWSSRELLAVLDGLRGLDLVGADVVEFAPAYDDAGETTALAAAEVAWSLLELMVEEPAAGPGEPQP
ncbi:arginase family protein [Durotheca rogersii]|uniref:arginase family protein n=1 Tax=Durotheca rogersii TaxID=419775 RepID=UPI00221FC792|nr:arginase family protein [Durotheca rogersii]KAI5864847.1 arginase family protein [Durotheca rogersii]